MIKLDHNLAVLEHSGFPAICRVIDEKTSIIICTDFTPDTRWELFDSVGVKLSENERDVWGQIRGTGLNLINIPYGWTIHIPSAQELLVGSAVFLGEPKEHFYKPTQPIVTVAYAPVEKWGLYDDAELQQDIREMVEKSITKDLEELMMKDHEKFMNQITIDTELQESESEYDMTVLEAFDELTVRARRWWFTLTAEEANKHRAGIMLNSGSTLGTHEMIRMFVNQEDYDGIRSEVTPESYPQIQALDEVMRQNKVREEFAQMFGNRMLHAFSPHQRELLGKKIVEWAQGL